VARIKDVVFDSAHPASLARFWAAALDGYDVAPYDEAELDRLRAAGIDDPEDDPTVLVEPSAGGEPPGLWIAPATVRQRQGRADALGALDPRNIWPPGPSGRRPGTAGQAGYGSPGLQAVTTTISR
jgi:hypothetical protein